MPASNTDDSYGFVTRTIHWVMALLVISMIPLGVYANGLAHQLETAFDEATASQAQLLFSLHKTIGVFIFFTALVRIVWALSQPKPEPLHPNRRGETFLASLVHWLLYASLLLVPLTGWIHHAATTGFAPIWWPFGQSLPFVPKSNDLAETFASLHIIFERVLVISILLHLLGALKHHFFDRDATLKRMWNGTRAVGAQAHPANKLAPLVAAGVYGAAIGVGAGLGLFSHVSTQAEALETVASEWSVTDGSITIRITQLGAEVEGSFADWTSEISFDPEVTEGEAGRVLTTISIGSLTLGSVTSQALGPDYFDASAFPLATYEGTLIRGADGHHSDGVLTIKDAAVPVSFPFELVVEEGVATMTGEVVLDRFAYGIGASTGEGDLGAQVVVQMALTAALPEE